MVLTLNEENRDTLEEYIKRADVLAKADYDANYRLIITAKDVRNIPRADVMEVKHGRWIEDKSGEIVCSQCGTRIPEMYSNADSILKSECRFCHYCGAKMDGEQ